jgi:mannitol/fructose-specific phosphotransferase system IIA component (Ntr-type)
MDPIAKRAPRRLQLAVPHTKPESKAYPAARRILLSTSVQGWLQRDDVFFLLVFSSSPFKHSSNYYILKHDFTQTNT